MNEMDQFFEALSQISTGDRASLRRNCGELLKNADGQAVVAFYGCLPGNVPHWQEDCWFAAACFSCLWDADQQGERFEKILSSLKEDSDSMEHRLASLLDLKWDEDGYLLLKICRILKMARSKGMVADCKNLLNDFIYWNSSNQGVQRKWARAMYIQNSVINEED